MSTLVDAHSIVAVLQPLGLVLDVKDAQITLDEGKAPYAQLQLTCALLESDDRNAFDLRDGEFRLDVRTRQDFGQPWSLGDLTADIGGSMTALTALLAGQPLGALTNRYYVPWNGSQVRGAHRRFFDLYVTERVFDDKTKELTVTAESDEALLLGDALIQTVAWDPGTTSLKAICSRVLARYGAALGAGALDAVVAVPAATVWQPGVGAWKYLNPMLEAASLRLWCDELGVWHLSERQETTPGAITITPTGTMTGHRDTMTLDPEVVADAVVVEYRWTDEFDLNQVAYDVAGAEPARAAKLVERRNTRYPGPGAAAGLLNRGQGRGRVLDVEAVSDYRTSPGMTATITPPYTDAQTGYVSAVSWRYPDAVMDVATRGLVDTPPTSWLFTPTGISWLDIPAGVSWLTYTP